MRNIVNEWWAEITRFLTGDSDNARPIVRRIEQRDVVGQLDHHDADGIEPAPLPAPPEAAASGSTDCDVPVPLEENIPPVQAPPPPTEPYVRLPDEKDPWLQEQLEDLACRLDLQGSSLQKIMDAVGTVEDSRRLLEEQERLIQDLTTRLREAEDSQTTNAVLGPVVSDMIQIFDTVWGAKRDWHKQRQGNADEWVTNCLDAIEGEVLAMLNRHGVVLIQDTTEILTPGKQRVVGTESPRQVRDGEVLARVRPGFVRDGRVVRPEEVIVAKTAQGGVR